MGCIFDVEKFRDWVNQLFGGEVGLEDLTDESYDELYAEFKKSGEE